MVKIILTTLDVGACDKKVVSLDRFVSKCPVLILRFITKGVFKVSDLKICDVSLLPTSSVYYC